MKKIKQVMGIGNSQLPMIQNIIVMEDKTRKLQTYADSLQDLSKILKEDEGQENSQDRQVILRKEQEREHREIMADHFKEMADVMNQVAENEVRVVCFGEKKKRQIIRLLALEGIALKELYFIENGKGYYEIGVFIRDRRDQNITAYEVAAFFSSILNKQLMPSKDTEFFLTKHFQNMFFREKPRYRIFTGIARKAKENEVISGDNYSLSEVDDRHYVAMISDGMGSGEKAFEDSEIVINMMEKFLDAGMDMEVAIQMMNDTLLADSEKYNMSTLDICSIDLYSGICNFLKVGAAETYIKKYATIERIEDDSLPLGMFHKMNIINHFTRVEAGDYIIMLSDGILEDMGELEGELFLWSILGEICESPKEVADLIMEHVIEKKQGKIKDDMTVLVMEIHKV